jgi:hypothetical protein
MTDVIAIINALKGVLTPSQMFVLLLVAVVLWLVMRPFNRLSGAVNRGLKEGQARGQSFGEAVNALILAMGLYFREAPKATRELSEAIGRLSVVLSDNVPCK